MNCASRGMAAADESKAYATLTSDVAGAGVGAGAGSEAADTGLDTMIAEALAGIKGRVAAAAKAAGRTDSVRAQRAAAACLRVAWLVSCGSLRRRSVAVTCEALLA